MAIAPGVRFGPYVVGESIGSGGMGEVYRATDTKLKRDVALKVLPEQFLMGPHGTARFEREAEILASLNHPNIAQLYGLETADATTALVMELVEGPTLARRIARGPLPPSEAINISMQIAAALEAAHERGIVHRDLKPDNVKVRPDDVVKVLDFGIAKALGSPTDERGTKAPTAPAITEFGVVLGTTAYMSPEQLRGRVVDARSDIWSFGCVLYELLTGRAAFPGDDEALERGADMDALPKSVPPNVRRTIELCLTKDPRKRIADIRDVRLALEGTFESGAHIARPSPAPAPIWQRVLPVAAALIVGGILAGAYVWTSRPAPAVLVSRFAVTPPLAAPLASLNGPDIAIARDGRRFAYFAFVTEKTESTQEFGSGAASLYVRDLDESDARNIPGTVVEDLMTGAMNPFFSIDGSSIGFWSPGQGVRVVPLEGGAARKILDDPNPVFAGAALATDGTMVFSSGTRLHRVSSSGTTEPLTGEPQQNVFVVAPVLLPGARAVLFTIADPNGQRVAVLDLNTRETKTLIEDAMSASFAPTGHIVFARGTALMAVRFDVRRLATIGSAVTVLDGVRHPVTRAADYAFSATGTLVYVPDDSQKYTTVASNAELVWVERSGRVVERAARDPIGNPRNLSLSPDGKRVALVIGPAVDTELWIYDLGGRPPFPLVTGRRAGNHAWSADGKQIAFLGGPSSAEFGIYVIPADGGTPDPKLLRAGSALFPEVWKADDEMLLVSGGVAELDILAAPATSQGQPRPVVASPESQEFHPALSPDGRWLAYVSNRSGRFEIWIKKYPDGTPVRVSEDGGLEPKWAADGRELFYRRGSAMMAIAVATEVDLSVGQTVELFDDASYLAMPIPFVRLYDVAPDGRFLMIRQLRANEPDEKSPFGSIVVVQNWFEELKRLVPTE